MSWDAALVDDATGEVVHEVNYTSNLNELLRVAESAAGRTPCWPYSLGGWSAPEGAHWLSDIIRELETDPEAFREYEAPNGWGTLATLVPVLRDMLAASLREAPATWQLTW